MEPISITRSSTTFQHSRHPSFSRQFTINSSTLDAAAIGWKSGASWTDTDMIDATFKPPMSMSPPIGSSMARSPDSRMDIEENFCKNYHCCGQVLLDLHELVAHYDAMHAGSSDESTTSSMSSSPRSSFSAPGTPGPETAPAFDMGHCDSKLSAFAGNPTVAVSPQRVGAFTQPLSSVARTSSWQSYFPAADDDEDIFMSDESVMSVRDRNRARSLPDTTKCLSPSVLTAAPLPVQGLSARHSVPSLSSNYHMATPQQPTLTIPVPPNMPPAAFASRLSVVSLPPSSDEEEEDSEMSRWTHRSIKAKPSAKPLKEKAYKCPNPECQKSYKNPNGLKYHVTKGTCLVA